MLIDHWAVARQIQEDTGLTPSQILALPADEYARLSRRPTPAEAAIQALDNRYDTEDPQPVREPPAPVWKPRSTPQGVSLADMTLQEYAAVRGSLGVGGREYGRGALDGGSTADWIAAAQRKSGRASMQAGNVTEPPRIEGRFVRQEDMRDTRSAAQRFSNQANAFNF